MPKYMWQVTYTTEGAKGLLPEGGSGRRTAIEQMRPRRHLHAPAPAKG
jgi:hypothetical protein